MPDFGSLGIAVVGARCGGCWRAKPTNNPHPSLSPRRFPMNPDFYKGTTILFGTGKRLLAITRACPVCDQRKTKTLFHPKASPGPISECLDCGMVYVADIADDRALIFDGPVTHGKTDPRLLTSSNLDDVKGSWEFKCLPDVESEWLAMRQKAMDAIKRVERHTSQHSTEFRVLDVGSGWGIFLAFAKEHGWIPFGLEPLPACAIYARDKFNLDVITDTLRENTFSPEFFDVITSFQVFEHLPNIQNDIRILYKMLRQNGIIMIEVPNYATWTMRILRSRHRHFVPDHINFFSAKTLSRLLEGNGFQVLEHYSPTRYMSISHSIEYWLRVYLPDPWVNPLRDKIRRTSLWERPIGLNIGDIVTVVARKPSA
jgi:2-polyprenyl-3-methyl-5-hydroxy-6-metoxy-1,4-benzoquinol methylase